MLSPEGHPTSNPTTHTTTAPVPTTATRPVTIPTLFTVIPIPIPATVPDLAVRAETDTETETETEVRAAPTLHQTLDEADEFGRLEGFGEEGVDADVEAALDLVLRTGTDDREGKITRPRIGPEPSGGPQPVEARHHDIEGHHIGPHLMHHVQTLGTIGRGHDLEPFQLKVDPDQLPDDLVVVHNKHPTRRARHNSRVGPHQPPRPAFPHFQPLRATHPLPSRNPAPPPPHKTRS